MLYIPVINATEKLKFRAPAISKKSREKVTAVRVLAILLF